MHRLNLYYHHCLSNLDLKAFNEHAFNHYDRWHIPGVCYPITIILLLVIFIMDLSFLNLKQVIPREWFIWLYILSIYWTHSIHVLVCLYNNNTSKAAILSIYDRTFNARASFVAWHAAFSNKFPPFKYWTPSYALIGEVYRAFIDSCKMGIRIMIWSPGYELVCHIHDIDLILFTRCNDC